MNIKASYDSWRRYRRAVNELSGLTNRELDDLGISRGSIREVARRGRR